MEKVDKRDSHFPVKKMGSFFLSHLSSNRKRFIFQTHLTPSFIEPCIVSDPNLPGASPP